MLKGQYDREGDRNQEEKCQIFSKTPHSLRVLLELCTINVLLRFQQAKLTPRNTCYLPKNMQIHGIGETEITDLCNAFSQTSKILSFKFLWLLHLFFLICFTEVELQYCGGFCHIHMISAMG